MTTWMLWALAVTSILGGSAWLAEMGLRERGWPTRWPWGVSLALSFGLPLWRLMRPPAPSPAETGGSADGWTVVDPAWLAELGSAAASTVPSLSAWIDSALSLGWIVAAALATGALLGGLARLRRRASRWRRAHVHGESVLLSDGFGPAVVGVLVPEIVLPRWALRMSAEELRLACLHEAEHRDAGDPWLLLGGALAATLVPWNPVLWWQLRRLRAAVEVDCDARVLKRGASRRIYGGLLLELGAARSRSPLPVLALARPQSLLERRLKMIVRNVRERKPVRSVVAACLSALLLVVACETPAPTTPEGDAQAAFEAKELPFGSAQGGAPAPAAIRMLGEELTAKLQNGELRFFVDGQERAEVPGDLDPGSVERVEIRKNAQGADSVYIFTRGRPQEPVVQEPLVYVDGIRFEGDPAALAPEDIERVDVLKGDAAESLYGPEASAGVIRITMKEGAKPPPK